MKSAKDITLIGLYTALLLGGQYALSWVSGIEIVTVLFLCFCCVFGAIRGFFVATCFSLVRCVIFGFMPNVVVLYLVYYNLFALFFGTVGKILTENITVIKGVVVVLSAVLFSALFTMLDDLITPLVFGYGVDATKAYFFASFATLLKQVICTAITVSVFLVPIIKLLKVFERK